MSPPCRGFVPIYLMLPTLSHGAILFRHPAEALEATSNREVYLKPSQRVKYCSPGHEPWEIKWKNDTKPPQGGDIIIPAFIFSASARVSGRLPWGFQASSASDSVLSDPSSRTGRNSTRSPAGRKWSAQDASMAKVSL